MHFPIKTTGNSCVSSETNEQKFVSVIKRAVSQSVRMCDQYTFLRGYASVVKGYVTYACIGYLLVRDLSGSQCHFGLFKFV